MASTANKYKSKLVRNPKKNKTYTDKVYTRDEEGVLKVERGGPIRVEAKDVHSDSAQPIDADKDPAWVQEQKDRGRYQERNPLYSGGKRLLKGEKMITEPGLKVYKDGGYSDIENVKPSGSGSSRSRRLMEGGKYEGGKGFIPKGHKPGKMKKTQKRKYHHNTYTEGS